MPRPRNPAAPYSRYRAGVPGQSKAVVLPPKCELPVPPVPPQVEDVWTDHQKALWRSLWESPQATQWDDAAGLTVAVLVTYSQAILTGTASAWMAQEARYAAEALGLTPAAMQKLNWKIQEESADD